eukprot:10950109-Lingulodinium_polyedra.AAC.1
MPYLAKTSTTVRTCASAHSRAPSGELAAPGSRRSSWYDRSVRRSCCCASPGCTGAHGGWLG